MCGNSLIDEFEGIKLFDDRLLTKKQYKVFENDNSIQMSMFGGFQKIIDDLLESLFRMQEILFGEQDDDKKEKLITNVENTIDEIIRAKFNGENNTEGLAKYEECLKQKTKPFFLWKLYFGKIFRENGGFDAVIGNPPYGARFDSMEKEILGRLYNHQCYQLDSYLIFIEQGIRLLKDSGYLGYIIPNTWISNITFRSIRKHIFNNRVLEISHYHKKVFKAVVDTEVLLLKKEPTSNKNISINIYDDKMKREMRTANQDDWKASNGKPINIFVSDDEMKIIKKMEKNSKLTSDIAKVTVGMKPYQKGKGQPKQTKENVEGRIFDKVSVDDVADKKLLRGSDIEKYLNKWNETRWIKYGKWLAEPRYSANFDADCKIVLRQTGDSLIATIDREQFVCMNNMHIIHSVSEDYIIEYLLALINSKLMNFYYQYLNPEKGEALAEVKKTHVEMLKIKKLAKERQQVFKTLVDEIIGKRKQGDEYLQQNNKINQMVYELYDLTDAEIRIVEESVQ